MAKMSKEQRQELINKELPGYKVVEQAPPREDARRSTRAQAAANTDELRRMYSGGDAASQSAEEDGNDAEADAQDELDGEDDVSSDVVTVKGQEASDDERSGRDEADGAEGGNDDGSDDEQFITVEPVTAPTDAGRGHPRKVVLTKGGKIEAVQG
jgi:hypothetical protein